MRTQQQPVPATGPAGSRCRRPFTLIELLVVISIIAILASLLLPALSLARDQARIATCASQERQQGAAIYMYAGDSEDWLPWSNVATHQNILIGGDSKPCRLRLLVTEGYIPGETFRLRGTTIAGTANNSALLFCPGLSYEAWPWTATPFAYWVNSRGGYSYVVPRSTGSSAYFFIWKMPSSADETARGRGRNSVGVWSSYTSTNPRLTVLVGCFAAGLAYTEADPHNLRGASALYYDQSVRFVRTPWGDTERNFYDSDAFWSYAGSLY